MRIHYDNIPGMNLSPHRFTKKVVCTHLWCGQTAAHAQSILLFIPPAKEVDGHAEGLSSFERGGGTGNN